MSHSVALNFADGKTFFIDVHNDELLLNAAVRQGITLPLDCREGVCGTCQGLCESGVYKQDYVDEDALTEQELAARKILACQTRVQSNASFYFDHDSSFCQAGEALTTSATVIEIQWVSDENILLTLQADQRNLNFLAGQYARIHVPGSDETRAYSFAHAPNSNGELQFLIRYLPDGVMGQYLKNSCQIGAQLDLELPFGSFYLRQTDAKRPLYFMAGGTGLSAFLAILEQCEQLDALPPIHLYYAVRSELHLCEQQRLAQYQKKFSQFHYYPVVSQPSEAWTGLTGHIQNHLDVDQFKDIEFDLYMCGPPALIDGLTDWFNSHEIKHGHYYAEKFIATAKINQAA